MNHSRKFLVKPGDRVKLGAIDPDFTGRFKSQDEAEEALALYTERLKTLQEVLYAEHRHALLICLQAMDSGGKDGTISHVMGAMNPQGCRVVSFKQPSTIERDHDFFWRAHNVAPARGEVVIFNRSHYEDVLVPRVHKLLPKAVWQQRYKEINALERYLSENETHVLKFYLHISKGEQLRRFKARLDDPGKQWKISEADYTERQYWDTYMDAFDDMLSRCSTKHAPWFVIPANHKWFRNLAVAEILMEYMESLKMKFPPPTVSLKHMRNAYRKAAKKA